MITSFLFVGRISDSRSPVDWLRLYVSRVLRLTPLYWLAMPGLMLMVGWRRFFAVSETPDTV